MNFLKGRTNRAGYWVGLATIVVLVALLMRFAPSDAHVSEAVLVILAIPRLHDIGRTGWWVLAGIGVEVAGLVVVFLVLPPPLFLGGAGVVTLVILALMVWLGAIPGEA